MFAYVRLAQHKLSNDMAPNMRQVEAINCDTWHSDNVNQQHALS